MVTLNVPSKRVHADLVGQSTHYSQVGVDLLNGIHCDMQEQTTFTNAMDRLFWGLKRLRQIMSPIEWTHFAQRICPHHPVCELIHQDPLTRRSFEKPRGYAGDALTLDFIYQMDAVQPLLEQTSTMGQNVNRYLMTAPAAQAVRNRRVKAAQTLDHLVQTVDSAQILAIACGHLREILLTQQLKPGYFGRFIAFDQDIESLAVVEQEYGRLGIDTAHGTVEGLLTGQAGFVQNSFDLVYALGIFDYLVQPLAQRLIKSMFDLLQPGGRMLLANFLPGIRDVGYMESFMAWRLIYRTAEELERLTVDIPCQEIAGKQIFTDSTKNIAFLEIHRG